MVTAADATPASPAPQTNLHSTVSSGPYDSSATVTWADPANGPSVRDYVVTLLPTGRNTIVPAGQHTATFDHLAPGRHYQLRVWSDGDGGLGGQAVSTVTTARLGLPYTALATPVPGYSTGSQLLVTGHDRDVVVGQVPAGATAVAVSAQVQNPTSAGYLRLTAAGTNSTTSNVLFTAGQRTKTLAVVPVVNGKVRLHLSAGNATVYLDTLGCYPSS